MPAATRHIRTIMVPLDGSAIAEQALPTACAIADEVGAGLRLVLVHQRPNLPLDPASATLYSTTELCIHKGETSYLQGIRSRLRQDGRVVSAVTVSGSVVSALLEHARETKADLIVMATHGRGPLQRLWLGSVADGMVRESEIPVLLVRPAEEAGTGAHVRPLQRILVPLDGSKLAEEALEPAAALARAYDAEIDLVQVVRPVLLPVDPAFPLPSVYDQELSALDRAKAQDYLHDIAERYLKRGLRVTAAACLGWDPVETLLELARPPRYGLLALATHGRGGVQRLAMGSVADKLVRAAEVPVLVCRPVKFRGSAPRRRAVVLI
jgi:nucleotide-binding universal stress UspA family protein